MDKTNRKAPDGGTGSTARIERAIVRVRGLNVILDADLAALYGVTTRALNQAVQRNRDRFPPDFLLRLSQEEAQGLRSQFVISNGRGGRRHYPYAFTEQGVAMLSGVLRSPRAVAVNIEIMRAFVQLRRILDSNTELSRKILELEKKYDGQFQAVFQAIRALMSPPPKPRPSIGFRPRQPPGRS